MTENDRLGIHSPFQRHPRQYKLRPMKFTDLALLALGATAGAFARYKITETPLLFAGLPMNVLIVNVVGAFILGVFVVLFHHWHLDTRHALMVAVGFCGSLTTMSSLALESADLLTNARYLTWAIHILTNVGLSIAALLGGKTLTQAMLGN